MGKRSKCVARHWLLSTLVTIHHRSAVTKQIIFCRCHSHLGIDARQPFLPTQYSYWWQYAASVRELGGAISGYLFLFDEEPSSTKRASWGEVVVDAENGVPTRRKVLQRECLALGHYQGQSSTCGGTACSPRTQRMPTSGMARIRTLRPSHF